MGKEPWTPASAVWAKYQALTSAFALLDGAIYGLFFPYATFADVIPIPPAFITPISYPCILALATCLVIVLMENYATVPNFIKFIMYGVVSPILALQLTLVPGSTFLAFTALLNLMAACQREPKSEVFRK